MSRTSKALVKMVEAHARAVEEYDDLAIDYAKERKLRATADRIIDRQSDRIRDLNVAIKEAVAGLKIALVLKRRDGLDDCLRAISKELDTAYNRGCTGEDA